MRLIEAIATHRRCLVCHSAAGSVMMEIFLRIPLAALAFIATATIANAKAPSEPIDHRVDIGGRLIRLTCQGDAGPTVVVDAGMGTAPAEDPGWRAIADRIAEHSRVCLYDRAAPAEARPRLNLHGPAPMRRPIYAMLCMRPE